MDARTNYIVQKKKIAYIRGTLSKKQFTINQLRPLYSQKLYLQIENEAICLKSNCTRKSKFLNGYFVLNQVNKFSLCSGKTFI